MRRWWDSTTTTICVTVIAAVVLGMSLRQLVDPGLLYLGLPQQQVIQNPDVRLLLQLPGRVAALLDVLDATPDIARPDVVAAAQRPFASIRLLDAPVPKLVNHGEPETDLLRHQIEAVLTVPRPVIVAGRYQPPDRQSGAIDRRVLSGVMIETALRDGHWLLFVSNLDPTSPVDRVAVKFSRTSLVAWLAISLLLGVLLSHLAARRLIRPVLGLATAVEQFGGSGDAPPLAPGGPWEVRAMIRAVNRMQQRLRRFNEDRTRMMAAISHDLRTPLTRLRLRSELVEDPQQQARMLADIDTMSKMIESVLSFARDDATREPRTPVDLSALVEGICQDASDAGEPARFTGPRGITISCRPTALRRAISNLVDNAIRYGGCALVTLSTAPDHVVVLIEDEGPGIPRSERERVFEPFYRMDAARDPNAGGVGLGLSVTRSVVWEHGGDISLNSRKGGGLSVRLELPVGPEQVGQKPQFDTRHPIDNLSSID